MKKKNLWRIFWVCLFVASLIITVTAFYLKAPSTAAAAEEGLDYAVVKNIADFRKYIDNNYPASTQDIIESDWSGKTPLYQFTIPSDGTLLVAVLSDQGYANGEHLILPRFWALFPKLRAGSATQIYRQLMTRTQTLHRTVIKAKRSLLLL